MNFREYIESLDAEKESVRGREIERIANACYVHISTVYRWVNGTVKVPKLKREKIAQVLNKKESELWPVKKMIKR
jgi:transposase